MNRARLDNWCERGILGLVLAALVFGPLATGAVRLQDFLVLQTLTVGVLGLWLLRLWLNPRTKFLWPPICWIVLAFVGYAIGRYFTCEIEYVGRQELLRILVYAFLFFAILNNLHGQEETQIISFILIFLAMGISFVALYQFLTGSDKVWTFVSPYKGRGSGSYICPNHLAGFLEMLLPLALAYTLVGRGKALTKVLLGYAALVLVAGIGVTVSRGSWVAAGITVLMLFGVLALYRSYRLPAMLALVLLVAGGAYFVGKTEFFKARFIHSFVAGSVDLDTRADLWAAAVRIWRDHVWFGGGPGHYDYRFRQYRPAAVQLRPDRAHNEYLNTLADWGVVGLALVGAALTALGIGVAKTWRHVRRAENDFGKNQSNKFAFVLGATLGLIALLLHSTVDFNMQIPANALLAVTLMALLSSHQRFATDGYWLTASGWGRILGSLALAGGIAYLGYQTTRLGREAIRLQRANQAPLFSPQQVALLEAAHAVEPKNFETTYRIGEAFRLQSREGNEDYRELAETAMVWYRRGMTNNPLDGYNYMRTGWCLDQLDRFDEAEPYFNRADELDPNNYFMAAHIGWHYIQTRDYAAARPWLERSLRLERENNTIAAYYLDFANRKLLEAAQKPANALRP